MRVRKNKVSEAISIVLLSTAMTGSVAAFAEEAKADDDLEVIEIRGIRSSVAKSLATKQDAKGFVDAITAEDVGKLPDANVAETLQRVSGVSIERSRGEGDFISIRGLGADFVKGTMNGRTLLSSTESVDPIANGVTATSAGRATNFDILPAELITSLEVAKSASASQIEGGIAGSVEVKTARPLTLGDKFAFTTTGTYREFNDKVDPSFSGLYSWSNEENDFGFLTTVSYSERSIREDFSRSFFWLPLLGAADGVSRLDTNNDGTGDIDVGEVYTPLSNNAEIFEGERERLTIGTTLEWSGDSSEFVVDALFSRREISENHQNFIFLPIFPTNLGAVNADGSQQTNDLVVNNFATNIRSFLRPELTTDIQDNDEDLFAIGAHYATEVGDWAINLDASYSKSEGSYQFDRVRFDAEANGAVFDFSTQVDQGGYIIRQLNQGAGAVADLGNPDIWSLTVFDQRTAENTDTEEAFKIDAERELDFAFISTIELGARYSSRQKILSVRDKGNGFDVRAAGLTASDLNSFERGGRNFLDGEWNSNIDFSRLVFPDNNAAREAIARQQSIILAIPEDERTDTQTALLSAYSSSLGAIPESPTRSFDVTEDVFALYAQANIDTEIGDMHLTGDFGIRYVNTDVEVNGSSASFIITDTNGTNTTQGFDTIEAVNPRPITFENDYTNVLPSMNLRLELSEDMFLRAALSKTISRAPLSSFSPALDGGANAPIDENSDGFQVALTGGNPLLEPYESTNFDIGYEYYFGDASAFYVAAFVKDLDNYVVGGTIAGPISDIGGTPVPVTGIVANGGATGQGSVGSLPADIISSPINAASGDITGVEVGIQQGFDSGFGYIANVSTVDSEADFTIGGETSSVNFFGVSDLSYNLTGYYESGPLQARISYNYRDEYLVDVNPGLRQEFVNDAYGQVDASISYDLNENMTVVLSLINLNDEDQKVFTDLPQGRQYYSLSHVGRRGSVAIRGNF